MIGAWGAVVMSGSVEVDGVFVLFGSVAAGGAVVMVGRLDVDGVFALFGSVAAGVSVATLLSLCLWQSECLSCLGC